MPSSPSNTAQVLLLAPAGVLASAPEAAATQESPVIVPTGPAPRHATAFALLLSLALHLGAGVLLWHWTAELMPAPERPALQVRLRAGGGNPVPAPLADHPPAPPAPVAAAPKPHRPLAPLRSAHPPEVAKTATTPAAAPAAPSQPEPTVPSPDTRPELVDSGTDVLTPPLDPVIDTATVRVLDWLAQHRRYPGAARRARLQGTVEVVVVLMPDGRLVNQRIAQSSGHSILDKAALDLLRRASPVPMSAFFTGEARQLELRLPIIYRLSI